MNAPDPDTFRLMHRLMRQLFLALNVAIDEARKAGVTFAPDSQVEQALADYSAWSMTIPDDDEDED